MKLDLIQPELDRWVDDREGEGWNLREADDESGEIWIVFDPTRSLSDLEALGAVRS